MTPKQGTVYAVIEQWWKRYGYAPSIDEIMLLTGDKSRSNVSRIMNDLVRLGLCKKHPNKRRTIRPSYLRVRELGEE